MVLGQLVPNHLHLRQIRVTQYYHLVIIVVQQLTEMLLQPTIVHQGHQQLVKVVERLQFQIQHLFPKSPFRKVCN